MIPIRLLPTATMRRKRLAPMITETFTAYGLPPSWGLAFACVESAFRPWVINQTGGDARRGGAWGLFQLTYRTTQGLGFFLSPELLLDAGTNTSLAAQLVKQLRGRWGSSLQDVAAAYNSGRPYALAPEVTKTVYCPRVMAMVEKYESEGGGP